MNYRVLLTFIGAGILASGVSASLDGEGRRGHDEHTSELSGQYDPRGPFPTEDGATINETPDSVERGPHEHKGVGSAHHKMKHADPEHKSDHTMKHVDPEHKSDHMKAEEKK
ncbi:MAG: hypothetical protein ACK5TR_09170 [Alphaproteobacteria bacterium]|nr:hypothetical protein [Alphaproteobacteria bacterium]